MEIGFEGAPITQALAFITLASSLALDTSYLSLSLNSLYHGQLWRLITCHIPFANTSQLIVGLILFYNLRVFERFMGPRKFGALVFLTSILSSLAHVALLATLSSMDFDIFPNPGPFFFIYALLPLFYRHIPRLHSSRYIVLGFSFSEKSWMYLLAIQLALSNGVSTLVPAISGLIAGLIYSIDGLGLQNFRLPEFVATSFVTVGSFFSSLFHGTGGGGGGGAAGAGAGGDRRRNNAPPPPQQRQQQQQRGNYRNNERNYEQDFPPMQPPAPSEEAITMLLGLGFERAAIITALQRTNNNIDAAADWLLSH